MHAVPHASPDWRTIDATITRLAASQGAIDLDIGRWLLVAQREGVDRTLGFGSFAEYVERRLGYDARTTFERLRVARKLEVLPTLTALLREGRRAWSAVRELTRVVTPENEAAWVEASENATVRQVQAMVAGREPGDLPWDERDPLLTTHRLVVELSPDELAEWQEAAEKVRLEIGPAATNREVMRALVHKELGQRPESKPGYQAAVTLCLACERSWQRAGGELVEVASAVGDCARCDAEIVGVVDVEGGAAMGADKEHVDGVAHRHATAHVGSHDAACTGHDTGAPADDVDAHVSTPAAPDDEPTLSAVLHRLVRQRGRRVLTRLMAQVIGAPPTRVTPRLRAAVHTRDRGRCVVPGCRNFRFVDLHHQHRRADGGPNTLENLLTLCTRHHRMVHDGVLAIEGSPERGLVVRHEGGVLYGAAGRG